MTCHVLLFNILWQAEPNEARFEDLPEWVAIVEDEARTKLKALELFMQLQNDTDLKHTI